MVFIRESAHMDQNDNQSSVWNAHTPFDHDAE
jgi:hypothetical protein